jgi:hypothetical protein
MIVGALLIVAGLMTVMSAKVTGSKNESEFLPDM